MDTDTNIERQKGQGQPVAVSDEMFKQVKAGIETVNLQNSRDVWVRRAFGERTRFCVWPNQYADGRKYDTANQKAFPFEGAMDSRYRLADMILRLQVAMCKASCKMGSLRISGVEVGDNSLAGHITTFTQWVLNSRIGHDYRLEVERFANYGLGDSPALSLMHVGWKKEERVRMASYGAMDILQEVIEGGGELNEQTLLDLEALLLDPEFEEELLTRIATRFPALKPGTIKSKLKELREEGKADFPESYVHRNHAEIKALRVWDEVFIPATTRSPSDCRYVYRREWFTLADIEAKAASGEWTKEFVEQLKLKKGKTAIPEVQEVTQSAQQMYRNRAPVYKDLYEVFYAYLRATNDDGVTGIYVLPFSAHCEAPAAKMTLLDYPHGDFPFAWFVREVISKNLLDSRGVSELLVTDQNYLKTFRDLTSNHAQLFSLPPYVTDMRTERDMSWRSLGRIRKRRQEMLEPIKVPDMPRTTIEAQKQIMESVSMYFGLPVVEIPALVQQLLTQDLVDNFLDAMRDVVRQVVQLSLKYMNPDDIRRVCGAGQDLNIEAMRDNLYLLEDIQINFDSRTMDIEYIKVIGELARDILLAIDTDQTIDRAEMTDYLTRLLPGNVAEKVLRPVQRANEAERKDEMNNMAMIASGLEPDMKEDGQNFGYRASVIEEKITSSPEYVLSLTPLKREMLEARVQHLQNQAGQAENAQTGRTLGRKVTAAGV